MAIIEPIKDLNKYGKFVGLIFIGLGILHIILSDFLSIWWGIILIGLGIIAFFYRAKSIIIMVGVALIVVGLLNISTILYETSSFWLILGILQIIWGIQELRRYKGTKQNPKYNIKEIKKKSFVWYSLRISFWIMIGFWILSIIFEELSLIYALSIIWIGIVIFNFVVSIIHLVKYKNKAFAILSLVLSSVMILLFIIGFMYGFLFLDEIDGITNSLNGITSSYTAYQFEEELIEEFLTEKGYEVISVYIINYSADSPIFELYDIEDNNICDDDSEEICYSDKVAVHVEMKSLGNRNDQVWDALINMASVYENAFTYTIDIKSLTDTCNYLIFGQTYTDWQENFDSEYYDALQSQIDELVICS